MNVLREYKTFDNKTGEIKIDCKVCHDEWIKNYIVTNNDKTILTTSTRADATTYFTQLLEMDKYIASKVRSYEVYVVR